MPEAPVREMTLEEWERLPEHEPGELVDGRLVEEEVTDFVHEAAVVWLAHLFQSWCAPRGGFVGGSEAKFAASPTRGRKPDLSVYLPGGSVPPRRGLVRVPPDVVVEVLSPTARDARRDRIEKMEDYAAFGVRYYWIVDPDKRLVEVFERAPDGRYVRAAGAAGGRFPAPGCAGLEVELDALWAYLDRLAPGDAPRD